jgi:hypothetical protein
VVRKISSKRGQVLIKELLTKWDSGCKADWEKILTLSWIDNKSIAKMRPKSASANDSMAHLTNAPEYHAMTEPKNHPMTTYLITTEPTPDNQHL